MSHLPAGYRGPLLQEGRQGSPRGEIPVALARAIPALGGAPVAGGYVVRASCTSVQECELSAAVWLNDVCHSMSPDSARLNSRFHIGTRALFVPAKSIRRSDNNQKAVRYDITGSRPRPATRAGAWRNECR